MIYAMIEQNGKAQLCCVDKIGQRAFLTEGFFYRDLNDLCIRSNHPDRIPETMEELIGNYDALWADDMALFFGSNPGLGISLDPDKEWVPLIRLDEIWSPLSDTRGRSLLE
ncbi:MAG: hypothetical protein PHC91_02280 [Eubacteriales bacterium]|nr:hypothetical protein [Eubacteriales bacterium]